jgi:plastocyanin
MVRRAVVPLSLAAIAAAVASLVPMGGAGAETNGVIVVVRDSSYTPAHVGIRPDDVVLWTRPDGTTLNHSVTSDDGRFDVELNDQNRNAGFRFQEAGTYAYHCKYHGSAGGGGMAGVVMVDAVATTTTTAPGPTTTTTPTTGPTTTTTSPTTTTTVPPTTTTTKPKPPKTTTTTTTTAPPPTTTTTAPPPPAWEPPPPPPPPPPSSGAMAPPPVGRPAPTTTAQKRGSAPSNAKDRPAAANPTDGKGSGPAPPTTDTTAAPPAPDPAAVAAAEAAAAAAAAAAAPPPEAAPAPNDPQPVEPLDQSILDALAAANDKPPDNGSKLLIVAGIGLGLFILCVGAWAWYHRSSRYMPA